MFRCEECADVGRRSQSMRVYLALCLGWALATASFSGCGGGDRGPERVVVSGNIAYRGQPIADGRILFAPIGGALVPTSGAVVKGGKYCVNTAGGVPVGTHKIEIEAFQVANPTNARPNAAPPGISRFTPRQQYIPRRYNSDSQLQITIESGSRGITKDFNLTD